MAITLRQAMELVFRHTGKWAKEFQKEHAAKNLVRLFGGDESLVDEIARTRVSASDTMFREEVEAMRATGEAPLPSVTARAAIGAVQESAALDDPEFARQLEAKRKRLELVSVEADAVLRETAITKAKLEARKMAAEAECAEVQLDVTRRERDLRVLEINEISRAILRATEEQIVRARMRTEQQWSRMSLGALRNQVRLERRQGSLLDGEPVPTPSEAVLASVGRQTTIRDFLGAK